MNDRVQMTHLFMSLLVENGRVERRRRHRCHWRGGYLDGIHGGDPWRDATIDQLVALPGW